jgi:hypothetical protein
MLSARRLLSAIAACCNCISASLDNIMNSEPCSAACQREGCDASTALTEIISDLTVAFTHLQKPPSPARRHRRRMTHHKRFLHPSHCRRVHAHCTPPRVALTTAPIVDGEAAVRCQASGRRTNRPPPKSCRPPHRRTRSHPASSDACCRPGHVMMLLQSWRNCSIHHCRHAGGGHAKHKVNDCVCT